MRDGAVVDRQSFYVENAAGREAAECSRSSCSSSTGTGSAIPPQVVAPLEERRRARRALLGRAARRQRRRCAPRSAAPSAACSSSRSATPSWPAQAEVRAPRAAQPSRIEALESLRDGLGLDELPLRIECYDISNLGEQHAVGSMVVFEGGVAKKAHYRKFAAARRSPARTTSR